MFLNQHIASRGPRFRSAGPGLIVFVDGFNLRPRQDKATSWLMNVRGGPWQVRYTLSIWPPLTVETSSILDGTARNMPPRGRREAGQRRCISLLAPGCLTTAAAVVATPFGLAQAPSASVQEQQHRMWQAWPTTAFKSARIGCNRPGARRRPHRRAVRLRVLWPSLPHPVRVDLGKCAIPYQFGRR